MVKVVRHTFVKHNKFIGWRGRNEFGEHQEGVIKSRYMVKLIPHTQHVSQWFQQQASR